MYWGELGASRNLPRSGGVAEGLEFESASRYPPRGKEDEAPLPVGANILPFAIWRDAGPLSVKGEEPFDSGGSLHPLCRRRAPALNVAIRRSHNEHRLTALSTAGDGTRRLNCPRPEGRRKVIYQWTYQKGEKEATVGLPLLCLGNCKGVVRRGSRCSPPRRRRKAQDVGK